MPNRRTLKTKLSKRIAFLLKKTVVILPILSAITNASVSEVSNSHELKPIDRVGELRQRLKTHDNETLTHVFSEKQITGDNQLSPKYVQWPNWSNWNNWVNWDDWYNY